jgi:hypothetical protein
MLFMAAPASAQMCGGSGTAGGSMCGMGQQPQAKAGQSMQGMGGMMQQGQSQAQPQQGQQQAMGCPMMKQMASLSQRMKAMEEMMEMMHSPPAAQPQEQLNQ